MTKTGPHQQTILLHGILRSKTDMLPLARSLSKDGHATINILYPSRKMPLEDLTDNVINQVENHPNYHPGATTHFVTHSMGGLIARYYIHKHRPNNLGNVIMLSPPNTGSEFANKLKSNKILSRPYRALFGPAGQQLSTDHHHNIALINYPLGIIAGTKSINPLSPIFLPRKTVGPHDGIVPVERTRLGGMTDHITMPVNHTFMMFSPRVIAQVKHFLKHEKFAKY